MAFWLGPLGDADYGVGEIHFEEFLVRIFILPLLGIIMAKYFSYLSVSHSFPTSMNFYIVSLTQKESRRRQ